MTVTGVVLTLVLTDIYITLMIQIGYLMRLLLTRSESIDLTTTITLLKLYHLCLLSHTDRDQFHFHRAAFSSHLKSRVVLVLAKATDLRITLNLDGSPIISNSHTHPSHSETSRLLTVSLSLGIPVPRATQCMRDM